MNARLKVFRPFCAAFARQRPQITSQPRKWLPRPRQQISLEQVAADVDYGVSLFLGLDPFGDDLFAHVVAESDHRAHDTAAGCPGGACRDGQCFYDSCASVDACAGKTCGDAPARPATCPMPLARSASVTNGETARQPSQVAPWSLHARACKLMPLVSGTSTARRVTTSWVGAGTGRRVIPSWVVSAKGATAEPHRNPDRLFRCL
jgi:hypothetical protein